MNIPIVGNLDLTSAIYNYAGLAALFLGFILIVIIAAVVYYKYQKGEWFGKYPVKARIWEIRAGHPLLVDIDKARSKKDERGAWFYELKNRKAITMAVPYEYINPDASVDLIALSRDEYHPIRLVAEEAEVKKAGGETEKITIAKLKPIISEDFSLAYTYRTHKNYSRKPDNDFWTKFGGTLTIVIVGVFVLLILALVLKEMGTITTNLAAVASAFAGASAKLAACGATVPAAPVAP